MSYILACSPCNYRELLLSVLFTLQPFHSIDTTVGANLLLVLPSMSHLSVPSRYPHQLARISALAPSKEASLCQFDDDHRHTDHTIQYSATVHTLLPYTSFYLLPESVPLAVALPSFGFSLFFCSYGADSAEESTAFSLGFIFSLPLSLVFRSTSPFSLFHSLCFLNTIFSIRRLITFRFAVQLCLSQGNLFSPSSDTPTLFYL